MLVVANVIAFSFYSDAVKTAGSPTSLEAKS
jgi:hypothetical protein